MVPEIQVRPRKKTGFQQKGHPSWGSGAALLSGRVSRWTLDGVAVEVVSPSWDVDVRAEANEGVLSQH